MDTTLNVPGLLATSGSASTSDRYKFISSKNIVERLSDFGWEPERAFFKKSRNVSPLHARHCIRFSSKNLDDVGDSRPEIVMFNSHDGRSCLEMLLGIYRLVCSNGMTIAEKEFERFRIPHKGYKAGDKYINHAIDQLGMQATRTEQFINGWGKLDVPHHVRNEYYNRAMDIRFPEHEQGEEWILDVSKRTEDRGTDLWRMFNRSQEHLLNGGYSVTHTAGKKPRQARELTNIDAINKINDNLWSMTSDFVGEYQLN